MTVWRYQLCLAYAASNRPMKVTVDVYVPLEPLVSLHPGVALWFAESFLSFTALSTHTVLSRPQPFPSHNTVSTRARIQLDAIKTESCLYVPPLLTILVESL
ncbi:hypothetical protein ElyMa_002029900 [Elysia marginata]|uniref:Uncharacterized protein n=1 Tax=Elysia marginata TaxID=1093978 RepID=A0AAV4F670_9GAST|nr:hypothetical protein ElyMa_002029900 [Elysia marginata]